MKAMILAAGLGTRMRPLTDHLPKPLLDVGGQPLIVWHLRALARYGIEDVVINVAYRGQQIMDALGSGGSWGLNIHWSVEEEPLETAGGIIKALPLLGEAPFLLLNADVWWASWPFWQSYPLRHGDLASLLLVDNPEYHPEGDFYFKDGRLQNDGTRRLTFAGVSLMSPALFAGYSPGVLPLAPLLRAAISKQAISGVLHKGPWSDIGTPQRLKELDEQLRQSMSQATQCPPEGQAN